MTCPWRMIFNDNSNDLFPARPGPVSQDHLTGLVDQAATAGSHDYVLCMWTGDLHIHDTQVGEFVVGWDEVADLLDAQIPDGVHEEWMEFFSGSCRIPAEQAQRGL